MATLVEANMHEHIARTMYYLSVHLLFASIVALAAFALTFVLRASATTKYWIWVATALNFMLPLGALIDRLWAPHLTWARPLGAIGGPVWDMTQGWTAVVLALIWTGGTSFMAVRLLWRLWREGRDAEALSHREQRAAISDFMADGIPVSFG